MWIIWKCTCDSTAHPGETWYLEWSHYYSVHANEKDTFFLYKEYNGKDGVTITPNSSTWPAIENGTDINVAQVTSATLENLVSNS